MNRILLITFFAAAWMLPFVSGQGGLQYGLTVYPNFSGGRLAASTTASQRVIDSIEAREIAKPSLSLGLAVQWRGLKAGFRTGFQLTETGYRSIREPVPPGVQAPEDAIDRQVAYRNVNLELPAELLFFHELNDKDRLNFMMGFSAAYNLNNFEDNIFFSGERLGRERQKLNNSDFQRLQLAFQTGIGWQRDLGRKMIIFVQPTFQFWYTGLLLDADEVNRNLYSVGLKTGILLKNNTNQE